MSERTDESTRPSVASDLRRKVVTLSQFRRISAVDFLFALYQVEEVPFYYYFDESLHQE